MYHGILAERGHKRPLPLKGPTIGFFWLADDNYRSKPSSATNSLLRVKAESCCVPDSASSKQNMKAKPTLYDNVKAERNLISDKESNIRKTFLRMNSPLANKNHSSSHSQIVVFRDDYCI